MRRRNELKQEAIRRQLKLEKAGRDRVLKLEAARLKRRTDSAENHLRAKIIKTFVASVIDASERNIDPARVQRWKEWAMLQAAKLDPIATGAVWDDVNDHE